MKHLIGLVFAFAATMTFCSVQTEGQERIDEVQTWQVQSFREDAKLDDRIIHVLDFDGDGSVWMAVSDGLYHFDGYSWNKFTASDGLPSSYVRSVCFDRDGLLWIGTDQGVATFDGQRFDTSRTRGMLAGPSVRRIIADPDGSLWFCCDQWPKRKVTAGLTRLLDGKFTTWRSEDGLPSDYVSDYFRDREGNQFVLTDRGLAQFTENGFCLPWKEAGLDDTEEYVWSMVDSSRHGLIAATRSHFFQRQNGTWVQTRHNSKKGLEEPKLLATRDGEIYCMRNGTNTQFFKWTNGRLVELKQENGVSGGADFLKEDSNGAIWVCGFQLLLRWERKQPNWEQYHDVGAPIVRDDQGGVWFTNSEGVSRFHDQKWQQFDDLSGPVFKDADGRIWMSQETGLAFWDRGKLSRLHVNHQLNNAIVIGQDRSGTIWARGGSENSRENVCAFVEPPVSNNSQISVIGINDSCPGDAINLASVDPAGGLLCMVGKKRLPPHRLIRIEKNGNVTKLGLPDAAQMNSVPRVHVASDRKIWIYGIFGTYARDPGRDEWTKYATPSTLVTQIASGGRQTFSAGSGNIGGKANLSRFVDSTWQPILGLDGRIVGTDEQHRLFVSANQQIWTMQPTTGEVGPPLRMPVAGPASHVVTGQNGERWILADGKTYRYRPSNSPPRTRIVRADSKLSSGDMLKMTVQGIARFQPGQSDLDFYCSYRVDGGSWSFLEPLDDEIEIMGLQVGQHDVQVRLMDADGSIDPTPASVSVQVLPIPLQDRAWFNLAAVAMFMTVVGLALATTIGWVRLRRLAVGLEHRVEEQTMALGASERQYRALFEDSADPICLFGFDGDLKVYNNAAAKFLNIKTDEFWPIAELFVDAKDEKMFQRELREQGFVRGQRFKVKNQANSQFEVLLSANTRSDVTDGYQVIMRDVTKLVQLEERLRSKQKMEAIGRMAGGISHDFNNFLGVMVQSADLIRATSSGISEVEHGVEMILKAASRAKKLSQQIQTFSRNSLVESRVIDTRSVVEEILLLLADTFEDSIQLSAQLEHDLWFIRLNPEQLEQIVVNLIVNACHAMPFGGRITVEGRNVEVDSAAAQEMNIEHIGRYVLIQIRDTGTGIPPDVVEKVFDPFFSTKPHGKGTGLGLAIVSGIVRQSKGHVGVTSSADQGTCFSVYLPFCNEQLELIGESPTNTAVHRGDETILLVEDEPDLRELTCKSLKRSGYQVLVAENGLSATLALDEAGEQIDLVISDVAMPEMNGFELVDWIRERFPNLKVLLISGYPEPFSELGDKNKPPTPFLAKPLCTSELTARIRELLDEARVEANG